MKNRINRKKIFTGIVISDKMDKTCVVQVRWQSKHTKYQKPVKRAAKYKVHDEKNQSKVGDLVKIMETRPLSKDKRWFIQEILKKGSEA